MRLKLESLINFWLFFTFLKAKIGYFYIYIPSNHCFQAYFQKFCMVSRKNWWNFTNHWTWIAKMWVRKPVKLVKFSFTALPSSVFGKVGWLVGVIKHAFGFYQAKFCKMWSILIILTHFRIMDWPYNVALGDTWTVHWQDWIKINI